MTADLSALIARLEAAEAGSRELDEAISDALCVRKNRNFIAGLPDELWMYEFEGHAPSSALRVTQSLDAALALAERMRMNGPCYLYRCGVKEWGFHFEDCDTAYAKTPALALVIALLRAKQGEGE